MPLRIGDILVELGVLTEHMREEILEEQRVVGKPFGELAERMFGIDPGKVEDAWARQYEQIAGVYSFASGKPDNEALECVTARQAWQFKLLPVRFEHGELMMVTTRENLPRALRFAATQLTQVCFFVTTPADELAEALQDVFPMPGFGVETIEAPAPRLARKAG
ncbi:MAG: hypothetical protein ED559_11865 [Phycisphaera sp.]|nr:MAG: hypothetical protein ED559_11865 [Phycisphaera sp.]